MKRLLFFIGIYGWLMIAAVEAQSVSSALCGLGMQNVAEQEDESCHYMAWEDTRYRGTYRGLYEVVKLLLSQPGAAKECRMVVEEERIPQMEVRLSKQLIEDYRAGQLPLEAVMHRLEISMDTDECMARLRGSRRENRSAGKVDVVLYPQIMLRNAWMDKLYGTIINIAPALEVDLWKGASFTGQVIFPIWNNMKGQMDYIRAGMLLLRQEVRLPHNLFATLSAGNFNNNRMGVDLSVMYRTNEDRWAVGVDGGLTGSSTFYEGKWELSKWKRVSGSAWVRYTEPHYQVDFCLRGLRCVYGDYGFRADCTRHFGEVAVGVYAMYTGGEANGGFHLAVPIPGKRRAKQRAVRVRLPEYFDWEFEAQTGNEYAEKRLGRIYETRPDENRTQRYYHPQFIRNGLVDLAQAERNL